MSVDFLISKTSRKNLSDEIVFQPTKLKSSAEYKPLFCIAILIEFSFLSILKYNWKGLIHRAENSEFLELKKLLILRKKLSIFSELVKEKLPR